MKNTLNKEKSRLFLAGIILCFFFFLAAEIFVHLVKITELCCVLMLVSLVFCVYIIKGSAVLNGYFRLNVDSSRPNTVFIGV